MVCSSSQHREREREVGLEIALVILESKKIISGIHPTRSSCRKNKNKNI